MCRVLALVLWLLIKIYGGILKLAKLILELI